MCLSKILEGSTISLQTLSTLHEFYKITRQRIFWSAIFIVWCTSKSLLWNLCVPLFLDHEKIPNDLQYDVCNQVAPTIYNHIDSNNLEIILVLTSLNMIKNEVDWRFFFHLCTITRNMWVTFFLSTFPKIHWHSPQTSIVLLPKFLSSISTIFSHHQSFHIPILKSLGTNISTKNIQIYHGIFLVLQSIFISNCFAPLTQL